MNRRSIPGPAGVPLERLYLGERREATVWIKDGAQTQECQRSGVSSICSLSHSRTLERLLVEPWSPKPLLCWRCPQPNKAAVSSDPPSPHPTSLSPPSRRNPRWVHGDKESPAVQTAGRWGGGREGGVGLLERRISMFTLQKSKYMHINRPESSRGWGRRGNQLSETEHFTTIRPWMESVETVKAAVMASICVQHDKPVFINTFQDGRVPRQKKVRLL